MALKPGTILLTTLTLLFLPFTGDTPHAAAAPGCDQTKPSRCYWTAEVDGTTVTLPGCDYEDGNPDGRPCLWFSPRTGLAYYNDGSAYRNDNGAVLR